MRVLPRGRVLDLEVNEAMTEPIDLKALRGLVATVVTGPSVDDAFSAHLSDMRSYCDRAGFHNVEWRLMPAALVEVGRDECARHAVEQGYDWCLQIDADAAPFPARLLERMLTIAFHTQPDADVVGAYCQLKHPPYLPTIDTGTGTWEEHYPGEGVIPVIRTGGHCHLSKTSIYKRFGPPWYRTRLAKRPLDAMAELDNFARIKLHGENPFAKTDAWEQLLELARAESGAGPAGVGEDSAFCDAVKAVGGMIYVDTDLVAGHVAKRVITPSLLKEEMDKRRRIHRSACGVG